MTILITDKSENIVDIDTHFSSCLSLFLREFAGILRDFASRIAILDQTGTCFNVFISPEHLYNPLRLFSPLEGYVLCKNVGAHAV